MRIRWAERRSYASRFFRATMRPRLALVMVALMVGGWALALGANQQGLAQADETGVHARFLATAFGGALAFMGMFAGISRWVAEPAARKILAEHTNLGAKSHLELIARVEWDEKHLMLVREINALTVAVASLNTRFDDQRSRD